MSKTVVGLNDPKSVKKFSAALFQDVGRQSYFNKKFVGAGRDAETPIQRLTSLENEAGDTVTYDLVMQLRGTPTEGDAVLEGREEDLKFFTDQCSIDQVRHGVNTGGRMTRKRTMIDIRKTAKTNLATWWSRLFDERFFQYLSGTRGTNTDFIDPTTFAGFANNPLTAPDSYHLLPQNGRATGSWVQTTTGLNGDSLTLDTVDAAVARASVMGGGSSGIPALTPCMIEGEEHYVMVMHPFQEYALRRNTSAGNWLDIQKALTTADGKASNLFKGGLGVYNNVILHKHRAVIRFSDMNANGTNYKGARALFMGRQAAVVAFGSGGNDMHFDWHEELADHGNQIKVSASTIFGVKKTAFTLPATGAKTDFGVMAVDSTISDPSGANL
jgi:N4-gp56 family major capsid protein